MSQPPKPKFIPQSLSHQVLQGPQSFVALETTQTHSGPIPSPQILAGYEQVLSGSADRIIKMAEKEQNNRHQVVKTHQSHQFVLTIVGQFLAFFMGAGGISGGIYLVAHDKPITGFSVFFSSLGVLVGIYLYNRKNQPKPVDRKSED